MKKTIVVIILSLITFVSKAQNSNTKTATTVFSDSQSYNWLWAVKAEAFGGSQGHIEKFVTTDSKGNIIVLGYFYSKSITFGSCTLTNTDREYSSDIYLVKYDNSGKVLWAKSIIGGSSEYPYSVCIDAIGNIIVTGVYQSPAIHLGTFFLKNYTDNNGLEVEEYDKETGFIAKYDSSGNILWAQNIGGVSKCYPEAVTTDSNENIIIAGSFKSPYISFKDTKLMNKDSADNSWDWFLSKFDPKGKFLWAESAGGIYNESPHSVSVDADENILVSGVYNSPDIPFGSSILTRTDRYGDEFFLAKYNSSGNALWAKSLGGKLTHNSYSIANYKNGNSVLLGYYEKPIIDSDSTISYDNRVLGMLLVKYDEHGNIIWEKTTEDTFLDFTHSVVIDSFGNIIVTGSFSSPTLTFGDTKLSSLGNCDIYVAKYDSSGNSIGAQSVGGSSADVFRSVAIDSKGNIIVLGYFESDIITFGNTTLTNKCCKNEGTIFVAKLGSSHAQK